MTRKTLILSVSIFLVAAFFSCGRRHHHSDIQINTDSLFVDLGKLKLAQNAKKADKVFSAMSRNGLNGVVLYAEQGQVVYEKAFGFRDLSKRQKDSLRIDDAFQISSDSKMFTAEAVMLLKAQGKLDYDDDVRKHIPELPYEGITVRMLLNHRSGLPRYDAMADSFWPDRRKPFSNKELVEMLAKRRPDPYSAPDATFFYNNINYALLATVVERVSRQHFEDFMHDNIFEPLGMRQSFIYSMRDEASVSLYMPTEVQGHEMLKNGPLKVQNDYLNGVMGDKIMFSTVGDLFKFNEALDAHTLLPDSLQAEAFRPGSEQWKNGENYGFGWRMSQERPNVFFHFGWWKGYRSLVVRDVAHRRFLAILGNTTFNIPPDVVWEFVGDPSLDLPEAAPLK